MSASSETTGLVMNATEGVSLTLRKSAKVGLADALIFFVSFMCIYKIEHSQIRRVVRELVRHDGKDYVVTLSLEESDYGREAVQA
ncbi:MAG: hypothetical protein QW815_03545 [Nitrososphaerota archaeon]